jgi:hypothetical protein
VLEAIVTFAAEEAEHTSHTAFYIAGCALAAWAVIVSFVGIRGGQNWPSSAGAANGIMAISALLVVAACATAVITA